MRSYSVPGGPLCGCFGGRSKNTLYDEEQESKEKHLTGKKCVLARRAGGGRVVASRVLFSCNLGVFYFVYWGTRVRREARGEREQPPAKRKEKRAGREETARERIPASPGRTPPSNVGTGPCAAVAASQLCGGLTC